MNSYRSSETEESANIFSSSNFILPFIKEEPIDDGYEHITNQSYSNFTEVTPIINVDNIKKEKIEHASSSHAISICATNDTDSFPQASNFQSITKDSIGSDEVTPIINVDNIKKEKVEHTNSSHAISVCTINDTDSFPQASDFQPITKDSIGSIRVSESFKNKEDLEGNVIKKSSRKSLNPKKSQGSIEDVESQISDAISQVLDYLSKPESSPLPSLPGVTEDFSINGNENIDSGIISKGSVTEEKRSPDSTNIKMNNKLKIFECSNETTDSQSLLSQSNFFGNIPEENSQSVWSINNASVTTDNSNSNRNYETSNNFNSRMTLHSLSTPETSSLANAMEHISTSFNKNIDSGIISGGSVPEEKRSSDSTNIKMNIKSEIPEFSSETTDSQNLPGQCNFFSNIPEENKTVWNINNASVTADSSINNPKYETSNNFNSRMSLDNGVRDYNHQYLSASLNQTQFNDGYSNRKFIHNVSAISESRQASLDPITNNITQREQINSQRSFLQPSYNNYNHQQIPHSSSVGNTVNYSTQFLQQATNESADFIGNSSSNQNLCNNKNLQSFYSPELKIPNPNTTTFQQSESNYFDKNNHNRLLGQKESYVPRYGGNPQLHDPRWNMFPNSSYNEIRSCNNYGATHRNHSGHQRIDLSCKQNSVGGIAADSFLRLPSQERSHNTPNSYNLLNYFQREGQSPGSNYKTQPVSSSYSGPQNLSLKEGYNIPDPNNTYTESHLASNRQSWTNFSTPVSGNYSNSERGTPRQQQSSAGVSSNSQTVIHGLDENQTLLSETNRAIYEKNQRKLKTLLHTALTQNNIHQYYRIKTYISFFNNQHNEVLKLTENLHRTFPLNMYEEMQVIRIQAYDSINPKKSRTVRRSTRKEEITPEKLILMEAYEQSRFLNATRRKHLAEVTGLLEKQIISFFNNRRQRDRRLARKH